MKKVLKIILGLVVLGSIAIGSVFILTADMVKVGDSFFTSLKNNDLKSAYSYLSEDFKKNVNEGEFEQFINENSLTGFKEASWDKRSINGSRGSLSGTISTESGGVFPITLTFVKDVQGWKIYLLEKPSAGIQETVDIKALPVEDELIKMVMVATDDFAKAVKSKSCSEFYKTFSYQFKQQFTVEKLDVIYKSFYDLNIDLDVLSGYSPIFDEKPSIDENGVLTIKGYFPTDPTKFFFDQTYIYEGLGWKLFGYSVDIK